ncbi:MAG: transposase [Salinisphaera sp.]|nr:transposase [Salinisphaera sp.]
MRAPACQPAAVGDGTPGLSLAQIVREGMPDLIAQYGNRLSHEQQRALAAITVCRTPACGSLLMRCGACGNSDALPRSCGHRSCPACSHHTTGQWLDRQMAKRLPVDYFMATFTLPAGMRGVATGYPKAVYAALFEAASDTLKTFGQRHKLEIDMGLCAVLHTHARNLAFHPHVHVVVPGGGVHERRRQWRKLKGRYLFNARALAKVFRAKMLTALTRAGIHLPVGLPDRWIVDCRHVGAGLPALKYLSRYLYRGVISEHNLLALDRQRRTVTFRYTEWATGNTVLRTLPIADFLWRIARHVLPRGFRRVRAYGFLHHNAHKTLRLVQLILRVKIKPVPAKKRPAWRCHHCQQPMHCVAVLPRRFIGQMASGAGRP